MPKKEEEAIKCDGVAIDTFRFLVAQEGFNTFLKVNNLTKVRVRIAGTGDSAFIVDTKGKGTQLQSRGLKNRLKKGKSLWVVRINEGSEGGTKLSNYILVAVEGRKYRLDIAGLFEKEQDGIRNNDSSHTQTDYHCKHAST